jgi:hypothetical protein
MREVLDVSQRSMAEVVSDILQNIQAILRAELHLAKAEVRQEARHAVRAGLLLIAGAAMGLSAWTFVLWTAVLGLATRMPYWAATAIVGGALAVLCAVLISVGRARLRHVKATPERTAETLRDNLQWIKHSTR